MIHLSDKDFAYLPQGTEHFNDNVRAVHWAQHYALANRQLMMQNLVAAVRESGLVPEFVAGSGASLRRTDEGVRPHVGRPGAASVSMQEKARGQECPRCTVM